MPLDALRLPFDAARLDSLMAEAGLDALLVTSKHNVQYLLGGHRSFFFDSMDAIGRSRYLPVLIYPRSGMDAAAYIGNRMEAHQKDVFEFWPRDVRFTSDTSTDGITAATETLRKLGLASGRIGIEAAFLPVDSWNVLRDGLSEAQFTDAVAVLERLRAVKTADELQKLRIASEQVIDAMLAVVAGHGPGASKNQLVDALRREQVNRGLTFDYCLITAGTSLNRAPSDQIVQAGDIVSLDSGGNYQGYIGDVCRMVIFGEPDHELEDLLAEIDQVQKAAMRPVRNGASGREIYESAGKVLADCPDRADIEFVAHGMGLVSHEVPHLTERGPVPYPAEDAERPLEAGMVLSIETTLKHRRRGFIKLEDTVAVTGNGYDFMSDIARGWNRAGIQ